MIEELQVEDKRSDFASPKSGWRSGIIFLLGLCLIAAAAGALLPRAIEPEVNTDYLTSKVMRGNLAVTVTEQGTLESSNNTEIKCKVRGQNTVIEVVEGGAQVEKGEVLLRLDTLQLDESIAERTKYAYWSLSAAYRSQADVARSEIAIEEYEKGRFKAQLMTLEKQLAVAKSTLTSAQNQLEHTQRMFVRGFRSELQVEAQKFQVKQATLEVDLKNTEIDVLNKYTKEEEVETLRGNLKATIARHQADHERAYADVHRRDRALEERKHCVIRAPRDGLVIYPSAAAWKNAPDIEEGATVHKEQILLLMPDLTQMQVKVGVHESVVDRVHKGLKAIVTFAGRKVEAEVSSVATVTSPAGWWTGNVVKYDTIIKLPYEKGLKPGMSAEVQIVMATHSDVLMVPVAAVIETMEGAFCWVKTESGPERRSVETGDSNDVFIVIENGVEEDEDVILNPLAFVQEAQLEVLRPSDKTRMNEIRKKKKEEQAEATQSQSSGDEPHETGVTPETKETSGQQSKEEQADSRQRLPALDELRRILLPEHQRDEQVGDSENRPSKPPSSDEDSSESTPLKAGRPAGEQTDTELKSSETDDKIEPEADTEVFEEPATLAGENADDDGSSDESTESPAL